MVDMLEIFGTIYIPIASLPMVASAGSVAIILVLYLVKGTWLP
jgi:hypothetical protein